MPPSLASRSLLTIESLSKKEIENILTGARKMQASLRTFPSRRRLMERHRGRHIGLLFYEASTRTRVSFEFAGKNLGMLTTLVTSSASSIEKGESLIDTVQTLIATGVEAIVMRHANSGAAHLIANNVNIPVLNAGDGMHEHPSQGLLDAFTMLHHKKSLKNLRVLIVGDIGHSRVARSNIQVLSKFGADIVLCGPEALLPDLASQLGARITIERDFDTALPGADVVMMLRVQKERLGTFNLDIDEYVAGYQLTLERLALAKKNALVMHPGPMIRGMELTSEVADSRQSAIHEQVENGVYVRMALLDRAMQGL
jgi:aspartate carbamoyltransferase catalytic subunit